MNVKFELTNGFHGTKVKVIVPAEWTNEGQRHCWDNICNAAANGDACFRRLERRVRRALCASGCTCGVVR